MLHSMSETIKDCTLCDASETLIKLIGKPFINKTENSSESNIGEITKKFIEDNKDVLQQQKDEFKNKTYDKS